MLVKVLSRLNSVHGIINSNDNNNDDNDDDDNCDGHAPKAETARDSTSQLGSLKVTFVGRGARKNRHNNGRDACKNKLYSFNTPDA